jgi:hypothetical protein
VPSWLFSARLLTAERASPARLKPEDRLEISSEVSQKRRLDTCPFSMSTGNAHCVCRGNTKPLGFLGRDVEGWHTGVPQTRRSAMTLQIR